MTRTDAGQAEAVTRELAASEARYRFLAETIPVQIWTALPDGSLDYVSEQTAHHLGLTARQLLADGWQNVVHPDDLPLAIERWTHALSSGQVYEIEFRLKLASGEYAYHLARAVPQRDESGAIVRWFGTNTNVAEQREQLRQREALFEEVARQLAESEAAFAELRGRYSVALARLAALEPKPEGGA